MKRFVSRVGSHVGRHKIKYGIGAFCILSGGVALKMYGPAGIVNGTRIVWTGSKDLRIAVITAGLSSVPWKTVKKTVQEYAESSGKEHFKDFASGGRKGAGTAVSEIAVKFIIRRRKKPISEQQKAANLKENAVDGYRTAVDVGVTMAKCSAIPMNCDVAKGMSSRSTTAI